MSEKKERTFTKGLYANEKTGPHGSFLNVDLKSDEFAKWMEENTDDKGYCKITLYRNKEGSSSKNTHYGCLNDFKPEPKGEQQPKGNLQPQVEAEATDLPF